MFVFACFALALARASSPPDEFAWLAVAEIMNEKGCAAYVLCTRVERLFGGDSTLLEA